MNRLYIVMGVSGCGKSTIGLLLADALGIPFYDGDDFHPIENIKKMEGGIPLNDEDRKPWLLEINLFAKSKMKETSIVIACSALKEKYRTLLSDDIEITFIYLKGSLKLIHDRLKERNEHFMPISLLTSQFETLEEPIDAITVNIENSAEQIINDLLKKLLIN